MKLLRHPGVQGRCHPPSELRLDEFDAAARAVVTRIILGMPSPDEPLGPVVLAVRHGDQLAIGHPVDVTFDSLAEAPNNLRGGSHAAVAFVTGHHASAGEQHRCVLLAALDRDRTFVHVAAIVGVDGFAPDLGPWEAQPHLAGALDDTLLAPIRAALRSRDDD